MEVHRTLGDDRQSAPNTTQASDVMLHFHRISSIHHLISTHISQKRQSLFILQIHIQPMRKGESYKWGFTVALHTNGSLVIVTAPTVVSTPALAIFQMTILLRWFILMALVTIILS